HAPGAGERVEVVGHQRSTKYVGLSHFHQAGMRGRVRHQNLFQLSGERMAEPRAEEMVRDFYRLDSRERRVLVIGSGQARTVKTVGWLDPWPDLADFDVVIIVLPALDRV
ncbi:hypothetical protein RZS08_50865, partial [Arthrospira platensis SPKY1]|nr:hypothetical protein [Arthrospira platensis SPKY1]